jgi:hypothetical protein
MSKVRLTGATSGYTEITAPAVAGDNTITLPTGNGAAGQVLQTNGSGATSWETFKGPAFRAIQTGGSQTVTNNLSTKLTLLTAEIFDTNNCYSTSTQRFTPNVAGYYHIEVSAAGSGSTGTNLVEATVVLNGGTTSIGSLVFDNTLYSSAQSNTSALIYCNGSTDYVEAWGRVVGTGTITISNSIFQGFMVRPA